MAPAMRGSANPVTAADLARAAPGTVLPFAMHPDVAVVVDPTLFDQRGLYFNAARLDRSVRLDTDDYRHIVEQARIEPITHRDK
jgi:Ala-tRNA(Pro) deacylase